MKQPPPKGRWKSKVKIGALLVATRNIHGGKKKKKKKKKTTLLFRALYVDIVLMQRVIDDVAWWMN
jgi:hypothetical protein